MSHMIIQPFDTVYSPMNSPFEVTWHGLQTAVAGGIALDGSNIGRVFSPVVQTGFKPDFEAPISNVPVELAAELTSNPITDWKMILADLRGNGNGVIPLHVCKSGYQIHQNKDLFDNMIKAASEVLGADGFTVATVGTLGAYSQFFISLAIKGSSSGFNVGKGDEWNSFFNLVSSHNALVSSQTMLSLIRIVCMNTVQAAISDADSTGRNSTIKHTVNSLDLITPERFAANLAAWLKQRDELKNALASMKAVPMTVDGFKSFAAGIFTNEGSDELSSNSYNRIDDMSSLFLRGRGNTGESLYDGVNAFTEYFTSGAGAGRNTTQAKRIASANFGRGNEWKLQALDIASSPEATAEVMKRGAVLYGDKLKVVSSAN